MTVSAGDARFRCELKKGVKGKPDLVLMKMNKKQVLQVKHSAPAVQFMCSLLQQLEAGTLEASGLKACKDEWLKELACDMRACATCRLSH